MPLTGGGTTYSGQSFQAAFEKDVEGRCEHYPQWKRTSKNNIHENKHECESYRDESQLGTGRCICPAPLSSSACHLFAYLTPSRKIKLDGYTRLSTHLSKRSGSDRRNGSGGACETARKRSPRARDSLDRCGESESVGEAARAKRAREAVTKEKEGGVVHKPGTGGESGVLTVGKRFQLKSDAPSQPILVFQRS
jgi:hypothetical protein